MILGFRHIESTPTRSRPAFIIACNSATLVGSLPDRSFVSPILLVTERSLTPDSTFQAKIRSGSFRMGADELGGSGGLVREVQPSNASNINRTIASLAGVRFI